TGSLVGLDDAHARHDLTERAVQRLRCSGPERVIAAAGIERHELGRSEATAARVRNTEPFRSGDRHMAPSLHHPWLRYVRASDPREYHFSNVKAFRRGQCPAQ